MICRSGVQSVRRLAAVAVVGVVSLVGVTAGAAGADTTANRVSGNAFGLRAQGNLASLVSIGVPPQPQVSLNQGLPGRGNNNVSAGPFIAQLAGVDLGILGVGVLDVSTTGMVGTGGSSTSTATVANLSGLINADAVSSTCTADATGFHSSTTLTNLGFLATLGLTNPGPGPVTLTTPGTAVIGVLGVTVTLNEVVLDGANADSPGGGGDTPTRSHFSGHVNAVHIASTGILGNFDIVIAHAHCDISNRIT